MAINQNHLFEDLNGVKCAVVEKNVAAGRVDFLRHILEYNRYTVVVVPSPPPKAAAAAAPPAAAPASTPAASAPAPPAPVASVPAAPGASSAAGPAPATPAAPIVSAAPAAATPVPAPAPAPASASPPAPTPETFTVGVTDVMFNAVNAIFGRLLKAPGGHVVTLAYWQQKENLSNDEKPYFDKR